MQYTNFKKACANHVYGKYKTPNLEMTRLKLSRIMFVDTPKLVHVIERLRVTFTPNGKSKFVPRDEVFPNKYCRLLLITST